MTQEVFSFPSSLSFLPCQSYSLHARFPFESNVRFHWMETTSVFSFNQVNTFWPNWSQCGQKRDWEKVNKSKFKICAQRI
jgi:hypothetical protein